MRDILGVQLKGLYEGKGRIKKNSAFDLSNYGRLVFTETKSV